MGPYRIEQELKKHKIDQNIIYKYLSKIDNEIIDNKINKQIIKLIRSTKKKQNIRNKIYMNLLSLGYSNEMILRNINDYDL
jgi:SOS response regulatory protein OraA/RecX